MEVIEVNRRRMCVAAATAFRNIFVDVRLIDEEYFFPLHLFIVSYNNNYDN